MTTISTFAGELSGNSGAGPAAQDEPGVTSEVLASHDGRVTPRAG